MPDNRLTQPLDTCFDAVPEGWRAHTDAFRASPVGQALIQFVDGRVQAGATVYPQNVLHALSLTPLDKVRVVILGQDPYHGRGQAQGLAFSVPEGLAFPPSLRNIFQEIERDSGKPPPRSGDLSHWATKGALLLNTTLTVEAGQPASHAKRGWETLTDALIQAVAERGKPVVFMLWGAHAQAKKALIQAHAQGPYLLLESNHPSPLSARRPPLPFIGCAHFSKAKAWLAPFDAAPV